MGIIIRKEGAFENCALPAGGAAEYATHIDFGKVMVLTALTIYWFYPVVMRLASCIMK